MPHPRPVFGHRLWFAAVVDRLQRARRRRDHTLLSFPEVCLFCNQAWHFSCCHLRHGRSAPTPPPAPACAHRDGAVAPGGTSGMLQVLSLQADANYTEVLLAPVCTCSSSAVCFCMVCFCMFAWSALRLVYMLICARFLRSVPSLPCLASLSLAARCTSWWQLRSVTPQPHLHPNDTLPVWGPMQALFVAGSLCHGLPGGQDRPDSAWPSCVHNTGVPALCMTKDHMHSCWAMLSLPAVPCYPSRPPNGCPFL